MKLLLDECLPWRLKSLLAQGGHECQTVREAGFGGKENGELLDLAESDFDVFVTIDKNIRYQQDPVGRRIAVLIIRTASNDLSDIQPHIGEALDALRSIRPGEFVEVGLVR